VSSRETGSEHPEPVSQEQVAADFDRLTETYEDQINEVLAFGGREHSFYIDVKRNEILRLAAARFDDLAALDVLDLGCGIGAYHPGLEGRFRQLHGIDVSARSVDVARQKHPSVRYESFDGGALPYPDNRFDLMFTICVMHHVPSAHWQHFVEEMHRTLKPGGMALVFEHNPYNPATQYIVRTCEIDKDAVLLRPMRVRQLFGDAGFAQVKTRTILSVPPVGRLLSGIDSLFGHLPFGAQYYMSAIKT
jgi:ubiquinone/menaquinone biosynthesis C-methylase UbiE